MRHFQGYVYKEKRGKLVYWMARVCVTDVEGKMRNLKTSRKTKTAAKLALDGLRKRAREIAGGASVDSERMTFAELAKRYSAVKLVPAEYRGEKKIKGMRSLGTFELFRDVLIDHFGKKRIRVIKHADIEAFRNLRLSTPLHSRKKKAETSDEEATPRPVRLRSVASVNRELQLLRTILIWATRQGWIEKNPFHAGEPLINRADEVKRDRLLSFEEEDKLLAACQKRLAHLRPLIIAAIDTGMRRGELFKLAWADVDFVNLQISVRAQNTKTGKARAAIITDRLSDELLKLWEASDKQPGTRVFGIISNVYHGFTSACLAAEIQNLHFHDLRHAFVSRAAMAGILPTVGMKLAGHETLEMHSRYLNTDAETAARAREALNALYRQRKPAAPQLVN